jgi:hypothetical protein
LPSGYRDNLPVWGVDFMSKQHRFNSLAACLNITNEADRVPDFFSGYDADAAARESATAQAVMLDKNVCHSILASIDTPRANRDAHRPIPLIEN